ncbi:MAG: aminotransferase class I/II-fold pyridoxal phosphate-dependent enzyme [Pseudomonadales bacterium]|nr:aminotransferase class I/II-fold pyridoxal phosphate-dependent enzyme [Pseudomonadales bacterium]
MKYSELSKAQLEELYQDLVEKYAHICAENLKLDLTRGKPASDQLDLSNSLDGILNQFYLLQDGTDVRNYGGLSGLPEARELGSHLLELPTAEIMVGGNSSLSLMYQYISLMMDTRWAPRKPSPGPDSDTRSEQPIKPVSVKFLCPTPGYDRHFTLCEHFNIEMINIEMLPSGPNLDQIETLVAADPMIKGIWCVPKYSNPTGITYAEATVKRLARLPVIAGTDFRILWDNAYAVHHLTQHPDKLYNLMHAAKLEDTQNNIVMFGSTSKITYAGAGISFIGLSEPNLMQFSRFLSVSSIGPDKVNQLRHVRFLKDAAGIKAHMKKHSDIIQPKFELVDKMLAHHLAGKDIADWTQPKGGYFVSLNTQPGLAKKIIRMASEAGVKLTPAGATFPYGIDPDNQNIRIAPTYPSLASLEKALEVLIACIQLASVEQLINV